MKKYWYFLLVPVLALSACAPSQGAIQTAIAQTQAAQTLTPSPSPTATVNPCSDRGWADIQTYYNQFREQMNTFYVGMSKTVYLTSLNNYQDKINAVSIDACTEHARQTLIAGMGNLIQSMETIFSGGSADDATPFIVQAATQTNDAELELSKLGIQVTLQ